MLVYVARHGEAEHNLYDLAHDETVKDISLTANGIRQSEDLALKLKDIDFEAIYVSELQRTLQTANIINTYHNVHIITDRLLNDIRTGIPGQPFSLFKEAVNKSDDPWRMRLNDGESFDDEKNRAITFLKSLKQSNYNCVLIVTSGGLVNIMHGLVNNLENSEVFNRNIENADFITFDL